MAIGIRFLPPAIIAASLLIIILAAGGGPNGPARAQESELVLTPVATELTGPLFVTNASDGSGRLFIVEKRGAVWIMTEDGERLPDPFLDLRGEIGTGGERGLLSIAFPPGEGPKTEFHAFYTMADGTITISRFAIDPAAPNVAGAETIRARIPHSEYNNHNGGQVIYGPDGAIYFAVGDGGGGNDPLDSGQDPEHPLAKMYRIPAGSDEVEMIALGLRNPYRFSIDGDTMYLADVGQATWEEVNIVPLSAFSAEAPLNFGWSVMEGRVCFANPEQNCDQTGLILPDIVYEHASNRCSIIGGYVYRGSVIPAAQGSYIYGDYCTGEIFGFGSDLAMGFGLTSFGVDEDGELYVADQDDGIVYRIEPQQAPSETPTGTPTGEPSETPTATPTGEPTGTPTLPPAERGPFTVAVPAASDGVGGNQPAPTTADERGGQ